MKIDFAMLWDQLNMKYPEVETSLYGSHPVRGVKLLPVKGEAAPDYLYISSCDNGLRLTCNGISTLLNTDLTLDVLFNELQDSYNQLRDWDMKTHLALIEDCNIQKLLDLSQEVLGNPVTLSDPSYKLLAITSQEETPSPIFNQVRRNGYLSAETVEYYRLRGYMDELSQTDGEVICMSEGSCVTVVYPLRINGSLAGFLAMPCVNRAYSQGVAECFRYLADGIAMCMERQLHTSDIDRYMYEYLLIDILNEKLPESALEERLRYIDLPSRGEFVLLIIDGKQEYASITNYLLRQIAEHLPNDRVFLYQGQILVLLSEKRLGWALSELLPLLQENQLSCGVSRGFTYLLEMLPAYHQARAALRLGDRITSLRTLERLGVEGLVYEQYIFSYQHYAPYHMVEAAADVGVISPLLEKLIRADRADRMDHLRVLHGFLSCERRPTQTAELLHMHRNNVIYRVDRIETMLGISLDDTILRQELECSLLALELMDEKHFQQNAQ